MKPSMPIASVEMQEYLFSANFAERFINSDHDTEEFKTAVDSQRTNFRFQRFAVMNWLMLNGVSIPSELLSDQAHPPVGFQCPDMPYETVPKIASRVSKSQPDT